MDQQRLIFAGLR